MYTVESLNCRSTTCAVFVNLQNVRYSENWNPCGASHSSINDLKKKTTQTNLHIYIMGWSHFFRFFRTLWRFVCSGARFISRMRPHFAHFILHKTWTITILLPAHFPHQSNKISVVNCKRNIRGCIWINRLNPNWTEFMQIFARFFPPFRRRKVTCKRNQVMIQCMKRQN